MTDPLQASDLLGFTDCTDFSPIGYFIVLFFVFVSLCISLFSLRVNLRNTITTSISANRINWISTVRQLILRFLNEYNGDRDPKKLKRLYTEVALYCNPRHKIYSDLIQSMQKCIRSKHYVDAYYWEVLSEAQCVLDSSWLRMKREAGISQKEDLKMADILSTRFKETYERKWTAKFSQPSHCTVSRHTKVHKQPGDTPPPAPYIFSPSKKRPHYRALGGRKCGSH